MCLAESITGRNLNFIFKQKICERTQPVLPSIPYVWGTKQEACVSIPRIPTYIVYVHKSEMRNVSVKAICFVCFSKRSSRKV